MEFNCLGGPWHGKLLLRRPDRGSKGVLLVDRPAQECWFYEWHEAEKVFSCRDKDPLILNEDPEAPKNRYRAADEDEYDVIAAPWVR